jgi:Ca2+:H+ antiporter
MPETIVRKMARPNLYWLLVSAPFALVADLVLHNHLAVFVASGLAILPLAGLIGRGTDQLALHAGPRIGGLLNATFGNVTELIIAVFLILRGEVEVVKASLTGSILGNLLLVLGMSFLLGGLRHKEQTFSQEAASVHATSLTLAVIGLLMPALFVLTSGRHGLVQREVVSGTIAAVLIALYVGALLFTLITHEHLFRTPAEDEEPHWSVRKALLVLIGATAVVALMSELLVGALEPALEDLGLSKFFVGLVLVPIIGNAAEHSSAILMAMRDKVDVTLEIAIGSSTQIALFVAPALVFLSLAVGRPMDFVFTTFEVAAVGLSTLIVALISLDGRTNWLEGAQLIGAYLIMAISFFFVQVG